MASQRDLVLQLNKTIKTVCSGREKAGRVCNLSQVYLNLRNPTSKSRVEGAVKFEKLNSLRLADDFVSAIVRIDSLRDSIQRSRNAYV